MCVCVCVCVCVYVCMRAEKCNVCVAGLGDSLFVFCLTRHWMDGGACRRTAVRVRGVCAEGQPATKP